MGDTQSIELGTVVAGRYRVEQRLGEGGMGSVYRVEHVHTGQPLALKVLNPKLVENQVALERFRREASAPARINSDHVVKVTDADVARVINGPGSGPGDPLETALLQATDDLFANIVISDATWATLAKSFNAQQMLDVLITVGGYRSGSMLINTAGVQLDANMAEFRFPESMRPR